MLTQGPFLSWGWAKGTYPPVADKGFIPGRRYIGLILVPSILRKLRDCTHNEKYKAIRRFKAGSPPHLNPTVCNCQTRMWLTNQRLTPGKHNQRSRMDREQWMRSARQRRGQSDHQ